MAEVGKDLKQRSRGAVAVAIAIKRNPLKTGSNIATIYL